MFCSQNLSEFINICLRRWKFPKLQTCSLMEIFMRECTYYPVNKAVILKAFQLIEKYDFQLFDSIVIAAALEAKCNILYSEDMQHQQKIDKSLRIVNPFLT